MWSVLGKLGEFLGLRSSEPTVDLEYMAAVLDQEDPIDDEEAHPSHVNTDNGGNGVVCQHRVGRITQLDTTHGFIRPLDDDSAGNTPLYFKRQDGYCPANLEVGNNVVYLTYKLSGDSEWIVRKILYVENEIWDKQCASEKAEEEEPVNHSTVKEELETAIKNVIVQVKGRDGRTVLADPLQFCLDSVQVDFIPVEGDWLILESLVQTKETEDTVLQVDKVVPVRSRQTQAIVTHWNSSALRGIADNDVLFTKDCCEAGYLPKVGDKVRLKCIESEQGQLTWRALHVEPMTVNSKSYKPQDPLALASLLQNKQGVIVSENTNCASLNLGQRTNITIEVRNEGDAKQTLMSVEVSAEETQIESVEPVVDEPITLNAHDCVTFTIRVGARFVGRSTEMVIFRFEGFEIGRQVALDVGCASVTVDRSRGTQRTKHIPITAEKLLATRNGFIVPGVRPLKPASFVPVHLGVFVVPEKLMKIVVNSAVAKRKEDVIVELLDAYRYLGEPLNPQNYNVRWDTLIHLEDIQNSVSISRYNITAPLHRLNEYLSLQIPGLSERRPSLVIGDKVIARETWSSDNSWDTAKNKVGYEGFVHKVLNNEVLLKFNHNFHESCYGVYDLTFETNRTSFRRCHQAARVAFCNLSSDWLFPSCITYKPPQMVITEECNYIYPAKMNKYTPFENNDIQISRDTLNSLADETKACSDIEKEKVKNEILQGILSLGSQFNHGITEHKTAIQPESKTNISHEDNVLNPQNNETDVCNIRSNDISICNSNNSVDTGVEINDAMLKNVEKELVDIPQKCTPPRIPVVARFLQHGNASIQDKKSKESTNLLQQSSNISSTTNLPVIKNGLITLEEVEKTFLNSPPKKDRIEAIRRLTEKSGNNENNLGTSPFEQFLNLSNLSLNKSAIRNDLVDKTNNIKHNFSDNDNKVSSKNKEEKFIDKKFKQSGTFRGNKQNKIDWNSNTEMKLGNEKALGLKNTKKKMCKVRWFNHCLNHYQKEAVRNILTGEGRPLPYIIFGPPGTGKTITLVESILQIHFLIPDSRILIGTPSNSAADLVSERLLATELLRPGDLLRLVGFQYTEQGRLADWLRPYCGSADIKAREDTPQTQHDGVVNLSRHAIGRHRITIGTCNSLGVLYQMGFPRGHFTHVFIDEAGQATEPETLIPLAFLHSSFGQSVFAGDPLQLGPVVLSSYATHFGYNESLLSRLLQRTPYSRDPAGYPTSGGYNPHLVTRLLYNYRSLPEILDLPNTMFYNGDLISKVCEETSEEAGILARLRPVLPSRPEALPPAMVFHGVRGTNCQAMDSPSWYNPHEAVQVAIYLQAFYAAGLTPDQCGIISPYQAQVMKIRQLLESLEIEVPKVGSVEEFQGQERMAIVLSTVRSSPRLIESDLRHTVGFVASPQRLNVALTRARAFLVIVGNPHLLARDQYWRSVLTYCVSLNAYVGCDRPSLEN